MCIFKINLRVYIDAWYIFYSLFSVFTPLIFSPKFRVTGLPDCPSFALSSLAQAHVVISDRTVSAQEASRPNSASYRSFWLFVQYKCGNNNTGCTIELWRDGVSGSTTDTLRARHWEHVLKTLSQVSGYNIASNEIGTTGLALLKYVILNDWLR